MAAPIRSMRICPSALYSVFNGEWTLQSSQQKVYLFTKTCFSGSCARRHCSYDARRIDIASGKQIFTFDTHALVKSLEDAGFTTVQGEAVTQVLVQVLGANMDYINKNMVSKPQQEIMLQQVMTHLAAVKKDMVILEKSEFSALKHEYEKQHIEIIQMKKDLKDELTKLKSSMLLDMNLEKSRAVEAHSENRHQLDALDNKISLQDSESSKYISRIDNKIDKEIANLLATYERYRNDIMKYSAGAVMTCLTICLGFYRLWS